MGRRYGEGHRGTETTNGETESGAKTDGEDTNKAIFPSVGGVLLSPLCRVSPDAERMTPSVKEALLAGMAGRGPHGRTGVPRVQHHGRPPLRTEIVVVMALEDLKYSLCNWSSTKPMVRHLRSTDSCGLAFACRIKF